MEKAVISHNKNKANPASRMFPTLSHSFCSDYIFQNKIIPLTKKTNITAIEVELPVCCITGKKKKIFAYFLP